MLKIGLVVEGAHDYVMLKPILSAEFAKRFGVQIVFKHLQPAQDATGSIGRGGWFQVVTWCQRNSNGKIQSYFTPLFANDTPCDVIIIQLDGDAVEHSSGYCQIPLPVSPNIQDRVEHLVAAMQDWLALKAEHRPKIAFAVPVLQTESWVLGGEGTAWEDRNAKEEFQRTFNRATHRNLANFYATRSSRVQGAIDKIEANCLSYRLFQHELDQLSP